MGSRKEVGVKAAATTANVTCNSPVSLANINKQNTRPAEQNGSCCCCYDTHVENCISKEQQNETFVPNALGNWIN